MKKYTLVWILGALVFVLFFVVFCLLWKFSFQTEDLPQFVTDSDINQSVVIDNRELTWQEELAQWHLEEFIPATEQFRILFQADISKIKETHKYFQLVIGKYDVYSIFCLKQILNSFNVKYFLSKEDETPEVFLDTSNIDLLENIIKKLQTNKINTQAKEIWL